MHFLVRKFCTCIWTNVNKIYCYESLTSATPLLIALTKSKYIQWNPSGKAKNVSLKLQNLAHFHAPFFSKSCLFYPSWQATSFERPLFWVAFMEGFNCICVLYYNSSILIRWCCNHISSSHYKVNNSHNDLLTQEAQPSLDKRVTQCGLVIPSDTTLQILINTSEGLLASGNKPSPSPMLTHRGRDKMAATLADNIFICSFVNENDSISIKFYWTLFLRVQSTISHHWFR